MNKSTTNNSSAIKESVILKGIAQQILQMNVPTFEQANKLFKEFEQSLVPMDIYHQLLDDSKVKAELAEKLLDAQLKEHWNENVKSHKRGNHEVLADKVRTFSPETMVTNSQEDEALSNWKNMLTIDPPEGWRYGFPKAITHEEYKEIGKTKSPFNSLKDWCIANGYPSKVADSYGEHFHIQINGNLPE